MKIAKYIFWTLGFIILFSGLILFIVEIVEDDKRWPSILVMFISSFMFIGVFVLDAFKVMVINETAGDEYNMMPKESLIKILNNREIEYEKNKPRAYYLTLIREDDSKRKNG